MRTGIKICQQRNVASMYDDGGTSEAMVLTSDERMVKPGRVQACACWRVPAWLFRLLSRFSPIYVYTL